MKSKNLLIIAVIVAIAALIFLFRGFSSSDDSNFRIKIAEGTQPIAAPIYIAYEKGYFKDEGLDVDLISFATGRQCLDAVIGGNADFGTAAETPIMHVAFLKKEQSAKIVATMHRSRQNTYLVANKSRGIILPNDLKGKTLGVPVGTNAEYAASIFLSKYGLKLGDGDSDVKKLNLSPPEMIGPLANKNVDAVAGWQPHIGRCQDTLKNDATVFSFASVYEETYNLVASNSMVEEKKEITEKVLRALDRAINFIMANPKESIDIVARRISMEKTELERLWSIYRFGLDLDSSLIKTMRSQGEWAVSQGQHKGPVPSMNEMISSDALREVKKESVHIP